MTYLPPDVKKDIAENVQLSEDVAETVEEDVIITEVTKKTETVKYIPTKVPGIENYVLVQAPRMKTTAKRSSVAGPIPKKLQDPVKFYCDKYPCFYTRPNELAKHKKRNCLKEDPEYFCNVCHRGFFYENTVREHYYHEHTDIVLWHCKKCNEDSITNRIDQNTDMLAQIKMEQISIRDEHHTMKNWKKHLNQKQLFQ